MKKRASCSIILFLGIAALGLAGCAGSGGANMFGAGSVKPKMVLVTDFVAAPDVEAIDRGYSVRMDRNGGNFPILERKKRTLARVNDEIVASIVVTLREAGLEAEPGSEEALTLTDEAAVVSGRLSAGAQSPAAKPKPAGFGPGLGAVQADMTVSYFAGGGKRQLTTFDTDAKATGKPPAGKQAAARNAAIAAVLVAEKDVVKLSPDVEAQARRLGRAVGEKVVAYAKEQGWIAAPEAGGAKPDEQVKLPEPKPEPKRVAAKKPAAPTAPKASSKRPAAPEDEEPPDTGPPPGRQ